MLRVESENGWWLVTHPDHARLAGEFATRWGNERFARPHPRESVLHGIHVHDDGWAARDARPGVTKEGRPSAFSHELVGRYSAFEEIDLAEYLAVRESAVALVEERDAYAGLMVCLHTYNLLTARADRTTIVAEQLPLLDAFLERQVKRQERLKGLIRANPAYSEEDGSEARIKENFRLLQACDNLSLLSCVGYLQPATLLHPLATTDGRCEEITVLPVGPRRFRLTPYPLDAPSLAFQVAARHVEGRTFGSSEELAERYAAAPVEMLEIVVSA